MSVGPTTLRKLAFLERPHDHTTARALPVVSNEVSESQVIQTIPATPPRLGQPTTLSDLATLKFFDEGSRQEAEGVYKETAHIPLSSLDRVPRRRWPMLLVLTLLVTGAAAGAWWLGFRPPARWQQSKVWQQLHLPQMPPPAPRR
jgi:hypothetical protein